MSEYRTPLADRLRVLEQTGISASEAHCRLAAEGYKVGLRSVGRSLGKLRGPRRVGSRLPNPAAPGTARTTKPAPPPVPPAAEREAEHIALLHRYAVAADATALRAAAIALRRYECPDFAAALDGGATLFEALAATDTTALDILREPGDLAALARHVAADPAPFGYEPDEGESPEAFASFMAGIHKADRARAFDLLADALEIVGKP